ncbi:extracellular solute-binding protein [Kiloniella antarctica]|uniref:Extracellular solute-binding protein n=1 Tax=Kiloniella antarctica TaxID=1550907 RepID=A0ABW5BJU3_9PROT
MFKNTAFKNTKTQQAAQSFTRRGLLKSFAALVGTCAVSPLFSSPSVALSGELEVFAWQNYFSKEMISEFKKDTGIQLSVTSFDTNAEALLYLKATKGQGFDLVFPTATSLTNWYVAEGFLQPLDEKRLVLDHIQPTIWEKSSNLNTIYRGQRFAMPFSWGAEGMCFDSTVHDYKAGQVSWADQWLPENKGLVTARPHSALTTMALMLDGTGERLNMAYVNEEIAREVFGEALLFAIEHKSYIRQFWSDVEGLTSAFTQNNCVVGQAWDGVALELWKSSKSKFKFVAPKEGALAWLGTMAIPTEAQNVDQAYVLINWLSAPKGGGMFMSHSGFNSVVTEAKDRLDLASRDRFNFAFNDGAAMDNLNWWRPEPKWFQELREVYVRKYQAA